MYILKFLFLCLVGSPVLGQTSQEPEIPCESNGYELQLRADTNDGFFLYWEEYPGSPATTSIFERRNSNGELIWDARAERGCSQGVPHCYLALPYALDGDSKYFIESEMNYFQINDQSYVLFSHLRLNIIQAYFKNHVSESFSLVGTGSAKQLELEGDDFEIPKLFETVSC